jgi:LPS-assembly protein
MPLLALVLFSFAWTKTGSCGQADEGGRQRVRHEMPYKDGKVILVADSVEKMPGTSRYRAQGKVQITFQDYVVTGDEAEYDEETREGFVAGQARFSQGRQWLSCSRAEFNFSSQTGVFYDATGFTDREFFITGRTIYKTGRDTYRAHKGTITACLEERPKWSFSASSANIRVDQTARLSHAVLKIKNVPVFYLPYLILPMENKRRSSGLIPFHYGNSTSKGRVFSQGYYQTLGRSADLLIYGDYFTERGLALGGILRMKPNERTDFRLQAYGINDKLDQGGIQLAVDAESQLTDEWRAVAKASIASNFKFRQAFSDSFRTATIPQEKAVAFLTRNHNSISTNFAYNREEVYFPLHPLITRKIPSLELLSLGTPVGRSPLIFNLRASLEGLARMDSRIETQGLTQRLDFFPRLTLRLPSFKGFSLLPSIGIRETYYGAQLSKDSPLGVINKGLHRQYTDLGIRLNPPALERDFASSWIGDFKHVVEPFIAYRWIHGISDLDKIIRFDAQDAIADTNEIEYGIINRFFRNRKSASGHPSKHEFMSFGLIQKYYFDPTFGGAFMEGQSNSFRPLDTVTGFYQTGRVSGLAPISGIFRLQPRNGIHNEVRADFDARLQRFRNGSLSTLWQQGRIALSGTFFRILQLEPDMPSGNHIQGQIAYGSSREGLSASFAMSYNLDLGQLLNSRTRIGYTWDCCGLGADFQQFDLGLRTESRFTFSFTLKGIGNFGNMMQPVSVF